MKTIRLVFLVALVFAFSSSSAQLLQFGIKGGLNFPSINTVDGGSTTFFNSKTGWHAGATVLLNIPIIKVGADLLYSQTGFETDLGDVNAGSFDIPVFGKFTFLKIISIHAGPQFGFLTSAKLGDIDFKDEWEHKTVRFIAGAGVNLGPLDVHGRFIFPSTTTWQNSGEEIKNSNIQVSLAYMFGGKKD